MLRKMPAVLWRALCGALVWLPAIERVVLTGAALAALVPIWQWWAEREDRRLDRMANLAQTIDACLPQYQSSSKIPGIAAPKDTGNPFEAGRTVLCLEIWTILQRDPSVLGMQNMAKWPSLPVEKLNRGGTELP
jgi:hypothetical protein